MELSITSCTPNLMDQTSLSLCLHYYRIHLAIFLGTSFLFALSVLCVGFHNKYIHVQKRD